MDLFCFLMLVFDEKVAQDTKVKIPFQRRFMTIWHDLLVLIQELPKLKRINRFPKKPN